MLKITNRDLIPIIVGKSTDEKPTDESIDGGTIFYECDTKKKYTYNNSDSTWYEGAAL